jgi:hypothetical protein
MRARRAEAAAPAGRTIKVREGDDLQRALDAARPGDTLLLAAGASFVGPFTLPRKEGEDWITIRTAAPDSSLPPEGGRVTPAHAPALPKLLAPGQGQPAVQTAPGAHHYRLVGLEVRPKDAEAFVYDLVRLGDGSGEQDTPAEVPHHLVLDRCLITAYPSQDLRRGVALNSAATDVLGCHVAGIKSAGYDSQAVGGWNGPGPFRIVNNYLEAAGENLLFGGARPGVPGLVPSDIEVRRNHLSKPLSWRPGAPGYDGRRWLVKALLEIKSARRVLISENVMEYQWGDVASGYAALNLTVRGDSGPQATIEDVEISRNVIRHAAVAVNILGRDTEAPSVRGRGLRIAHNLFDDISGRRWNDGGYFIKISGMENVTVDHNTVLHDNNVILAYGDPNPGFRMTNNVLAHNSYGVLGQGTGTGRPTLERYFPGAVFRRNVLAGADAALYPPDNFYPPRLDGVVFADPAAGDYRLRAGSPYKARATDGTDVGCDIGAAAETVRGAVL